MLKQIQEKGQVQEIGIDGVTAKLVENKPEAKADDVWKGDCTA